MTTYYSSSVPSPIGPLLVVVDGDGAVVRIDFPGGALARQVAAELARRGVELVDSAERTAAVRRQLDEYFAGARRRFELALAPEGTEFQRRVWRALARDPLRRDPQLRRAGRRARPPRRLARRRPRQRHQPHPHRRPLPPGHRRRRFAHRLRRRPARKRRLLDLERGDETPAEPEQASLFAS